MQTQVKQNARAVLVETDQKKAITALVELIRVSEDEDTRWQAASSLGQLLTESEKMTEVVTTLKDHLSKEAYEVIWHCTQTMTYPAFYQAWHR
ncbi:HEAT repeat domain-containing protein [Nodularia spumigena]|uniref:HEAT repeat domain-containing protein n=1 Tax=Nodularia spumigena UHCC 0060 TaxID=3110300 RepID=A0ABU5UVS1_NODSP|nr:HEAT repeat domain-containing protein [Nodularia spumigena]MEA5610047.1 HEAT repeat domain-containing protein [Nodularia spumigena UHCC 0060]